MSIDSLKIAPSSEAASQYSVALHSQDWGTLIRLLIYEEVARLCPSYGDVDFDHHDILTVSEVLERIAASPADFEAEFKALNDSQLGALETHAIGVSERLMRDENASQEITFQCHHESVESRLHGVSFAASALAVEMKAIAMQPVGRSSTLN